MLDGIILVLVILLVVVISILIIRYINKKEEVVRLPSKISMSQDDFPTFVSIFKNIIIVIFLY